MRKTASAHERSGTSGRDTSGPTTATLATVLKRSLLYGALVAAAIAVVGCTVGGIFAGGAGILSALIGTTLALVFMGVTALTILFANRFVGSPVFAGVFFGIVLGGWLVKFVLFIVVALSLRGAPWINPLVLFLSIVAGVVASLVVDVVVVARSRLPYVGR